MKNSKTFSNLEPIWHVRSNSADQRRVKIIENKKIINEIKEIIPQCKISCSIKDYNIKTTEGKEFVVSIRKIYPIGL